MKINRSKAMVLVGMLASAACTSANDESTPGDGNSSGGSSSGGSGGSGGSASEGSGGLAGASTEGNGGMAGEEGSSAEGTGGMAGANASSEGSGGMAGSAAEGSGGAACDDSQGSDLDCASITPDSSCASLAAFHQGECESAKTKLKPRVAEAVGSCILGQSPSELCDALNTYDCVEQALAAACSDASAASDCTSITTACPEVSEAECVQTLSGMQSAFRAEAVLCMQDSIFDCDFRFCAAEGL